MINISFANDYAKSASTQALCMCSQSRKSYVHKFMNNVLAKLVLYS